MDFNWDQVKSFFFKAMLQGWVSGKDNFTVNPTTGFKEFFFREGDFLLIDSYIKNTTEQGRSFGWKCIFYKGVPIWQMTYEGFYPKSVIPFLKSVLFKAYSDEEFRGGRGSSDIQMSVDENGFLLFYSNEKTSINSQFTCFNGREEIINTVTNPLTLLGYHTYSGGAMVSLT